MTEQLILALAQPEPPSFANFVAGPNGEALAALAALAGGRSRETGVLLWGAPGAGKSHLLRAAVAAAKAAARPAVYCESPRDVPAGDAGPHALLAVDAVDTADANAQARLFTRINVLAGNGGQWLAASALPPVRLALREDLRTRLALGLVLEVLPLPDADKAAALAAYARERGFRLSDEVIGYLLAHGRRDMPSLVATLEGLDRASLAAQRSVTVPMLREWLQGERRSQRSAPSVPPGGNGEHP